MPRYIFYYNDDEWHSNSVDFRASDLWLAVEMFKDYCKVTLTTVMQFSIKVVED